MLFEKSPSQRASRVAIAGSIYMRRASLQLIKPKQLQNQNLQNSIRNPSYGKIIKNFSRREQKKQQKFDSSRIKEPLYDIKNNLLDTIGGDHWKKSPNFTLSHFDELNNTKIKAIEDKYRSMLSSYQSKKKSIISELSALKSLTLTDINNKRNKSGAIECRTERSTRKEGDNNIKQYQLKSKQLIIQKLSSGPKVQASQIQIKKQKVTNLYLQFFRGLKNQVMLEEELRNIKSSMSSEIKQEVLKSLKENSQIKFQLKMLQLKQQQLDPFDIKINSNLSPASLAVKLISKYKQCQSNWEQNVCILKFNQSQQIFQCLNFEKSQQISIKAFVRQLSFLLEKHLRNRDLLRIYNRLLPFNQKNFCQTVAAKQ